MAVRSLARAGCIISNLARTSGAVCESKVRMYDLAQACRGRQPVDKPMRQPNLASGQ